MTGLSSPVFAGGFSHLTSAIMRNWAWRELSFSGLPCPIMQHAR